jgi:DNA-binding PadR family transcriptional regulator
MKTEGDIDADSENEEHRVEHRHGRRISHWTRHTAMVPKGFLRHQLLKKLSEAPKSGSEIMSELENETKGYWKPSPGSIYPLLNWLQDQRYIKEVDQTEPGIRRYALTEEGKALLQTETKSREEINKHLEPFGHIWYGSLWGHSGESGQAARDLFRAVRELHHELRRDHPQETLQTTNEALREATKQIREITSRLQS